MGTCGSSFGIRVARVTMMLSLPVVILLALVYLWPAMEPWEALAWAFGVTWVMDQVGSFAMFYRGQQMSCEAERWFPRLAMLSTVLTGLYLRSVQYDPIGHDFIMYRNTGLIASIVVAFSVGVLMDHLWDSFVRIKPRVCWSDARCVYQCQKMMGCLKRTKVEGEPEMVQHFEAQGPPDEQTQESTGFQTETLLREDAETEGFEVKIPEVPEEDQHVNAEISELVEVVMAESDVRKENSMRLGMDSTRPFEVCSFAELLENSRRQQKPDAPTLEWPKEPEVEVSGQPDGTKMSDEKDMRAKARPPTRIHARLKPLSVRSLTVWTNWQRSQTCEKHLCLAIISGTFLGQAGIWLGSRVLAKMFRTHYWLAVVLLVVLIAVAKGLFEACLDYIVNPRWTSVWLVWVITAIGIGGISAWVCQRFQILNAMELSLGGFVITVSVLDVSFVIVSGLMIGVMIIYGCRLWVTMCRESRLLRRKRFTFEQKRGLGQVESLADVLMTAYGLKREPMHRKNS